MQRGLCTKRAMETRNSSIEASPLLHSKLPASGSQSTKVVFGPSGGQAKGTGLTDLFSLLEAAELSLAAPERKLKASLGRPTAEVAKECETFLKDVTKYGQQQVPGVWQSGPKQNKPLVGAFGNFQIMPRILRLNNRAGAGQSQLQTIMEEDVSVSSMCDTDDESQDYDDVIDDPADLNSSNVESVVSDDSLVTLLADKILQEKQESGESQRRAEEIIEEVQAAMEPCRLHVSRKQREPAEHTTTSESKREHLNQTLEAQEADDGDAARTIVCC